MIISELALLVLQVEKVAKLNRFFAHKVFDVVQEPFGTVWEIFYYLVDVDVDEGDDESIEVLNVAVAKYGAHTNDQENDEEAAAYGL